MGTVTNSTDFVTPVVTAATASTCNILALPFDLAREQYARAVKAGLIERSLLASANFGRTLCALEALTLGPWARRV
jgi:hypothetical protein